MHPDRFSTPRGLARTLARLSILALVTLSILGSECDPKDEEFFLGGGPIDRVSPVISFVTLSGTVLNDDKVCVNVTDEGGSGLNQVTASNAASLPVTPGSTAGAFNIGISAAAQGAHTIRVNASDNAGHTSTASTNIVKDTEDPVVSNFSLPANQSSSAASLSLSASWRVSDLSIRPTARFSLFTAGADNQCGTGDDQSVPQGTSGGQANPAHQEVTGTGTGMTRDFTASFTLFNGAPPGMTVVRRFCARVQADDQGRTCTNQDNPNTTTASSGPFDITWQPLTQPPGNVTGQVTVNGVGEPGVAVTLREGTMTIATTTTGTGGNYQFTNVTPGTKTVVIMPPSGATCDATQRDVNVPSGGTATANFACTRPTGDFTVIFNQPDDFYRHIAAGSSETCGRGGTNPPQPGAPYTIVWNGPGIVGGNTRSGMLDATGSFFDRQPINAFGTYTENVTVTSGGVTRSATGTKTVTVAQGSCPAPSSARFKGDVVALLPDGVTLLGLRPVAFRYIAPYGDPGVPQIGLIAEEVFRFYPDAVTLDAEGRPEGIYYGRLTGLVIGEVEKHVRRAVNAAIAHLWNEF